MDRMRKIIGIIVFVFAFGQIIKGQYITTVVGNGIQGNYGNGDTATLCELNNPTGVALDSMGNIYIADNENNSIRKVNFSTDIISAIVNSSVGGSGGDGGLAINAHIMNPQNVAIDDSGNIYIVDKANIKIRKITALTGIINTVAGNGVNGYNGDSILATSAELWLPNAIALDASRNLYIADESNNRIRKVDAITGIITTVAGDGTYGFGGDSGLATLAQLRYPNGVAIDAAGNIFICDENNYRIRKVDASTGIITTVAGGGSGLEDGGLATNAQLYQPSNVGIDSYDNIYICDLTYPRIRKVYANSGIITSIAGDGYIGYNGDNIIATSANLDYIQSVAIDNFGNVYIADMDNERIRKVTPCTPPPPPNITINGSTTFCQGDSLHLSSSTATYYLWSNGSRNQSINVHSSGNYSVTITDSAGCIASSTITAVTVNPTYIQNDSANICQGNTYTFPDGTSINAMADTVQTSHFTSINLCDSAIVTTLIVNPIYSQNVSAFICPGNTYTFPDGIISSVDTIDTSHLSSMNLCDSIIITTLIVYANYNQNVSVSICQGSIYTFPDSTTSNIDTIQTSHLTTINSCDSIIVTTLTVNTVDTSVTVSIPTFTSNATSATYHWMDCNAMDTIAGATNQSYTAIANGSYAVIVTQNGCTDTSSCYDIFSVGINNINDSKTIYVFPNPANTILTIHSQLSILPSQLFITDILGNEVYSQPIINQQSSVINLSNWSNGVYFYEIRNERETWRGKFVVEK